MTGSSSLESLEFLFQKKSLISKQISPSAPFNPSNAIAGGGGFIPQTAPSQTPKKRKILLDFNSCFRLWNPTQMACEIAKLKDEGFEVAFILQKTNGEIFESLIEDKAESGKKYDYKFKDKNGNEKSIFELSDKFIRENFSKLDHETSIAQLNLTRDESIILNYKQFDEVDKIFKQEYWDDKERVSVRSSLSYSFLEGAVEKRESYESLVASFKNDPTNAATENLLMHEDFNLEDQEISIKLNWENLTTDLFNKIQDEKKLEALFDKIPSLTFHDTDTKENERLKLLTQKRILACLWLRHSNFETLLAKARTLNDLTPKTDDLINKDLLCFTYLGENQFDFIKKAINLESTPSNIIERFNLDYLDASDGETLKKFILFIIAEQKKDSCQKDIQFIPSASNDDSASHDDLEFKIKINSDTNSNNSKNITLREEDFMLLFSDSEINQHFNLTEKFGNTIIKSLEAGSFLRICNLCKNQGFFERLNQDQKTQFLNILEKKIPAEDALTLNSLTDKLSLCQTLQHHLHLPKIKELTKSILSSSEIKTLSFLDLTPAFQDLLLEMHENKEIDLNKIKLPKESKLFAKFNKTQLGLGHVSKESITSLDSYLKNIEFCRSKKIYFDYTEISSQGSTASPLQITLFDLNAESLIKIKEKINSGELDPSKILSVDVLEIERDPNQKSNDEKIKSLTDFLQLFQNLKHAKVNPKGFNYDAGTINDSTILNTKLNSLFNYVIFDIPGTQYTSEQTITPISEIDFSATKKGDTIFMGYGSSRASEADSPTAFSMEETGKIIKRPAYKESLYIRCASQKLNPDFAKLTDNLFVDIDESPTILSAEITKFLQPNFEAKKTELEASDSQDKTICSFSQNLQANVKNILPSISPNNKIIGYYTEPDLDKVEFFKDEKSGFYYANTVTQCQIHYLIEGQELELQTPIQTTSELPDKIKEIITEYVGENPESFPLSVKQNQYKLPDFSNKIQFLDDLFKLENKGSCRHRVSALAHKFEENGLECGEDFRIIVVNGTHMLMEVKKKDNTWATLNLGGGEAILEKASEANPPLVLAPPNPLPIQLSMPETLSQTNPSAGSNGQSGDQNFRVAARITSFLARCVSCLRCGTVAVKLDHKEPFQAVSVPASVSASVSTSTSTSELVFSTEQNKPSQNTEITARAISLEELTKIKERELQNLKILESALAEIHQLKKVDDLESFKTDFEKFATENKSSSLLLKTTRGEELKNYLLRMSSSSQNSSRPDDDQSTSITDPTASALSFQAFYVSSPQDLTAKKPTLHIGDENKTVKITANTPLLSFLENAKQHADKQHVLIIDWGKFDANSQVAFNTMFDKNSRKIDDQEIPDNVKIVCIDSSKQQTTDSSILSRFDGGALDLSSIPKDQFTKSKIEASSSPKTMREIECDGEGLVNWKEKLFGRIIVDGDAIKWEKSDFVKSLEAFETAGSNPDQSAQKDGQINFKNFSLTQQQEMKIFFEQAKALGSIDYQDYSIKIPSDLKINFAQKEFEFTEVLKSFKPRVTEGSSSSINPDSKQLQLTIYQNSLASNKLPADIHLINSQLFDQLLTQPQIEGNQYQEKAGLIKSASTSDSKTLKLFLSEDLTKQQLYCLLNQAQEHQVALELYVAKDVKIPNADLKKFTQEFGLYQKKQDGEVLRKDLPLTTTTKTSIFSKFLAGALFVVGSSLPPTTKPPSIFSKLLARALFVMGASTPPQPRITITNNIEESLNKTITAIESANSESSPARTINLVNVEDILYGDLFGKNQHKIVTKDDGFQHFAFEKFETAVKAKLDAGETVILKGEFSAELLSLLHPQILDLQKKFSNLHFIIEDKNVSKSKPQSSKLSWLDPSLYKIEHAPEIAKKTTEENIVKEDYPEIESSIPDGSRAQADDFIKARKDKLLGFLQKNPILQIFGHSGVGKSSLLREIAKTSSTPPSDVAVYNELSSIEAWAQDASAKTKILVIDEFNVDGSTNFTLFRDLANNPKQFPQTIFHDGKSYELDAKHKVVFLGNPPNYGNRFSQKLFEDCQIPEWHLQDFPVSYIYEEILAKPIYAGLSEESKRKLSEEEFKEIAHKEIIEYKAKNQGDPQTKDILPSETVRELQEKVLKEIVEKKFQIQSSQVQNPNFIATTANQQNIAELQSALEIRKLQKSGELPPQYLGTCGVIFEGDSGVGKSVMIEAVLENRGITRIDNLENLKQKIEEERKAEAETEITLATKPHYYYKIPASLPIKEIEENLIKAFELGVIVVFDEMNTRIKEGGLEKTINALLTGQHPKNSEIKSQPGFMLIASVNKATNAGRSALSPAILHRSTVIKAKSLSEYGAQDFEKIIANWTENEGKQKGEMQKDGTQKGEISFAEKPDKAEIKEASEALAKLVKEQPKTFNNLRDLKKIMPEVLRELKTNNSELTRANSLGY